jgi:hypothetical protein
MIRRLCLLLLAVAGSPLAAQVPPARPDQLNLESQVALRCSAAFGIVASEQARGDAKALALPPLAARGKEFFVRSGAFIMQQAGLSEQAFGTLVGEEVASLQREAARSADPAAHMAGVVHGCLPLLDAEPPRRG